MLILKKLGLVIALMGCTTAFAQSQWILAVYSPNGLEATSYHNSYSACNSAGRAATQGRPGWYYRCGENKKYPRS